MHRRSTGGWRAAHQRWWVVLVKFFANMLLHLSSCKSVPYNTPYRQPGMAQAAPRSSSNLPETRRTPDNVQCCAGWMLAASAVLFGALTIYCASVIVARMLD
jgi:hypothetical protein